MTTNPTLVTLSAARKQQEGAVRWLRPLPFFVLLVVIASAFANHPGPGISGQGLAISLDLSGFILGGFGALLTAQRSRALHLTCLVTLLVTSAALIWLQPDGAGIAGIFVGVSFLAQQLRSHLWIPATVAALVFLAVVIATGRNGSLTTALLDAVMLGAFYGVLFLANQLSEANELAEKLVAELDESRVAESRTAALAERQRLAREMHDVLAHSLSGLMLQLEAARMMAAENPEDPRLPEVIDRAHRLGRSGLEEARRAIGLLRDEELPGPRLIAGLAAQFQEDRGIPCRFTISGTEHELGSEARLALYRVAQEALTNAAKHTHADRVDVHLAYEPSETRLIVQDFLLGKEATPAPAAVGGGYGLTGMRERAELLGGSLTTESTSSGFRVELAVPA